MQEYGCGQQLVISARLSLPLLGERSRTILFLIAQIFLSETLQCQSYSEYGLVCHSIDAACHYWVTAILAFKVAYLSFY